MSNKKNPLGFSVVDGKLFGPLRVGMTINGVVHRDFVMREVSVDDLLDAELESDITKPLNFSAQLMVRQLVKVGSFEGPFTVGQIRRMKPVDWRILRAAQAELDDLGEAVPESPESS